MDPSLLLRVITYVDMPALGRLSVTCHDVQAIIQRHQPAITRALVAQTPQQTARLLMHMLDGLNLGIPMHARLCQRDALIAIRRELLKLDYSALQRAIQQTSGRNCDRYDCVTIHTYTDGDNPITFWGYAVRAEELVYERLDLAPTPSGLIRVMAHSDGNDIHEAFEGEIGGPCSREFILWGGCPCQLCLASAAASR